MAKTHTLRGLRETLGLNQTQFWTRIHVTQSGGSRYEAGRSLPKPIGVLLKIAYGSKKESQSVVISLRKETQ